MNKKDKLIFTIESKDKLARAAEINIGNVSIKTPIFMPVGTNATVKGIKTDDLKAIGYNLILANAYHLSLRPGDKNIFQLGGLHKFSNWDGLILTDSGGFQAFSLGEFNKLTPEGYEFKDHLDGSKHFLSPQRSIQIQTNLGSNIAMCLDVCPSQPSTFQENNEAVKITTRWAQICFNAAAEKTNLFAIMQGGPFLELRQLSIDQLKELDFAGYAVGGVSVGESFEQIQKTIEFSAPLLPEHKPRYVMGIGDPITILTAIESGIDMFDCVLPTRNARNGTLFTHTGQISIKKSAYKLDNTPIDEKCDCYVCKNYSKAYLRHLYNVGEILSSMLNSWHNLAFLKQLVDNARQAIVEQRFADFKAEFISEYKSNKDIK